MTKTISASMSIVRTEKGMDYVQVLPDEPKEELAAPFRGLGYGQMQRNGMFDFIRKRRIRQKPKLKTPHGSLSFGFDGNDRLLFTVPNGQRGEMWKIIREEMPMFMEFLLQTVGGGEQE